jgi:hypothetical protein
MLLLRPPERSFPFWSIGADPAEVGLFGGLTISQPFTFPTTIFFGKVCKANFKAGMD